QAACSDYAQLLERGEGVPQDAFGATRLYGEACKKNEFSACARLGVMYEEGRGGSGVRKKGARELFERACSGGDMLGCARLGALQISAGEDTAHAFELVSHACEAGIQAGCVGVGKALETGRGTTRNPQRAAELYAKACEADDAE